MRSTALLLPLLLACGDASAQSLATLRAGREIRVETAESVLSGRMRVLDGDTLRMESREGALLALPLATVLRVDARHREPRARAVLKGSLLGLGVGLVAGWLAGTWAEDRLGVVDVRSSLVGAGAASGVAVGGYVGASRRIRARWRQVHP